MAVVTRNLAPMALARMAADEVLLVMETPTPLPDGSYEVSRVLTPYMARVTTLTADQIQRLQDGGITINSGANVAIPYEVPYNPDSIIWEGKTFKVMEATVSEGISIFTIDKMPIGFAGVEAMA